MLEFLVGILVGMFIWDYWCERDHWYREDLDKILEEEEEEKKKDSDDN
jgi:hypothetical protein